MKYGIIAAMDAEIDGLTSVIANPAQIELFGSTFFSGSINGQQVIAVRSGIGKVNGSFIATLLRLHFDADAIVMTGIAGGLGAKLLDTVVATGFVQHDVKVLFEEDGFLDGIGKVIIDADPFLVSKLTDGNAKCGIIATGDMFIDDKNTSADIVRRFPGAIAVDMECAAVAQVCARMNVPFAAIKTISDDCDEGDYTDFAATAAAKSVAIILRLFSV